ncbi:BON domain-containing protein [Alphaproteobacteria bacterium]|nr:BON domain-containing protein [Alphaproteobacteria bacterium]
MKNFLKNKIACFFIVVFASWLLTSCSQVIVGGATSTSMIIVQERSSKQAAIDILIKAKIEEAMFANNYDKLFSKVRVIVYEGRVLLVGTVLEENIKETANHISWNTKNVKEVANYITIGKNDLIDYVKDTRISLELRAKMLTDKEVSEVNFSVTTENRILYLVGIAQNNKELNKVIEHASNIAGVKKIVNLIKLKDLKDE